MELSSIRTCDSKRHLIRLHSKLGKGQVVTSRAPAQLFKLLTSDTFEDHVRELGLKDLTGLSILLARAKHLNSSDSLKV